MSDAGKVVNRLEPKPITEKNDVVHILRTRLKTHGRPATVSGPMVRYSKLAFRKLCHDYKTDITYTPMILAREFVRNGHARISDLTINKDDTPVVAQVGVNNVTDMLRFVEMICPYVDAIGINCGCPIREQVREGIGCALIYNEDLMVDMVSAVKRKYGNKIRLETKIRIHEHKTPERTLILCKRLCEAGVDWITIHGRLRTTRSSEPVDLDAIKYLIERIKDEYNIPVVANGDCFTENDMAKIQKYTGADGVMSARGLLSNPALFAGYDKCPWGCLEKFIYYCIEFGGLPYQLIQHHVYCMMENMAVEKRYLKEMMNVRTLVELLTWFETNFVFKRYGDDDFGTGIAIPYKSK